MQGLPHGIQHERNTAMSASTQITKFLRANPHGHLYVVVGYASAVGLAWLNTQTRGRPVTLIIGNAKNKSPYINSTPTDRSSALEFLARPDVQVKNWYRTSKGGDPSEAHAKAWMVSSPTGLSVMLGSANLTRKGLHINVEMMAVVADHEAARLWTEMQDLISKSWDISDRIKQYLTSDDLAQPWATQGDLPPRRRDATSTRQPHSTRAYRKRQAPPPRNRTGCARSIALFGLGLLGLVGSMIVLSVLLEALGS